MPRRFLMLCGLLPALLAFPAGAQASDASLIAALKPYKTTLTVDIILLAEDRTLPTASTETATIARLTKVQTDMAAVGRVARSQKPSTSTGRTAQSQVLTALGDAYGSAGDGLAAVAAFRAGKTATATADIANAQKEVAKSIPYFESSGKTLGLFAG